MCPARALDTAREARALPKNPAQVVAIYQIKTLPEKFANGKLLDLSTDLKTEN